MLLKLANMLLKFESYFENTLSKLPNTSPIFEAN